MPDSGTRNCIDEEYRVFYEPEIDVLSKIEPGSRTYFTPFGCFFSDGVFMEIKS
jgi:hypothetical protein